MVNELAPEHLELLGRDAERLEDRLAHYGGLFIGAGSAEVLGDYGIGPNHVLPTGGTARYTGGLSVLTFLRMRTWMKLEPTTPPGQALEDTIALARLEGWRDMHVLKPDGPPPSLGPSIGGLTLWEPVTLQERRFSSGSRMGNYFIGYGVGEALWHGITSPPPARDCGGFIPTTSISQSPSSVRFRRRGREPVFNGFASRSFLPYGGHWVRRFPSVRGPRHRLSPDLWRKGLSPQWRTSSVSALPCSLVQGDPRRPEPHSPTSPFSVRGTPPPLR